METDFEFLIAKKKLDQIKSALQSKEVIVIEGPPGCGKTWTLKRLLKDIHFELDWLDYKNEVAVESFLRRCLFAVKNEQPVYILIDNSDGMPEAIKNALISNRCQGQRLVFLFNSLQTRHLLSDVESYEIIQLNPLTNVSIKKLLKKELPARIIDRILEMSLGDARVALSLAAEYRTHGSLPQCQRDSSLEFFHSLGKVLYPRKEPSAIWQLGHLEEEEFSLFNSYLQFNCLEFIPDVEDLSVALDSFSLAASIEFLKEHPSRLLSFVVNTKTKKTSGFGFRKPPSFYFRQQITLWQSKDV